MLSDLHLWLPEILACAAVMLLSGIVKGILGVGLPIVALPLLMLIVDVPTAVALLMIPLIASNFIQAVEGKGTIAIIMRFWKLLVALAIGTIFGTYLFAVIDRHVLLLIIGTFAIVATTASFLRPDVTVAPSLQRWLNIPVGFISGIIGGMSTLFGPILSVYVAGMGLGRDMFVKVISIFYTAASIALLVGGTSQGTAHGTELGLSVLTMIPVYGGMRIGQTVRRRINPVLFHKLVIGVVWFTGANLIRSGLGY
jgi:uncharacterized membrane protein YfcA